MQCGVPITNYDKTRLEEHPVVDADDLCGTPPWQSRQERTNLEPASSRETKAADIGPDKRGIFHTADINRRNDNTDTGYGRVT